MKIFKFPILLFCLLLISPIAGASQVVFSPKEDVEASVKSVPCPHNERLEGVRRLFKAAGATDEEIQVEKFDKDKISNVVVRKKGTTDETIVIGAHYDRTNLGCGVVDNWTGVTIVSHIYKTLKPLVTNKSYVFVAFDREEEGLRGSQQMAKTMEKTAIDQTCAMVNFDSFGMAAPMALKNASSPKLLKLATDLADESKFKFVSVDIEGASSDSASFRDRKIPSITLSGLAGNWQQILHTSDDKLSKVNMDSVYMGYRFGLVFLAKLDATPCRDHR
jgi:Zn-dependent M28 family amino/carboxypeptidase